MPVDLRRGAPPVTATLDEGKVTVPSGVLAAAARAHRQRHPSTTRGRPRTSVTVEEALAAVEGRTLTAAAAILGISRSTLRRLLDEAEGPVP